MESRKPNKRRSLYVGDELENIVAALTGNSDAKFSSIVNQIADRYRALMAEYSPDLTADELLFVWLALEDAPRRPVALVIGTISYLVRQAIEVDAHPELDVDHKMLQSEIDSFGLAESLSLSDSAEKYWAAKALPSTTD